MPERPLVLGLGEPLAGDDGAGPAAAAAFARRPAAAAVEVIERGHPADLIDHLAASRPVVVVDAVRGAGEPGSVVVLLADEVTGLRTGRPSSSHGLGLAEALGIASALHGEACLERVFVVGVVAAGPAHPGAPMSDAVAGAIERAADAIAHLIASRPDPR